MKTGKNWSWMKKVISVFSVLLLACLVIACPPDGNGGSVDTDELETKIAEAYAAKYGIMTAETAAEVPEGRSWVTEEEMEDFEEAIDEAEYVFDTASDQGAVDAAVTALDEAIETFIEVIKDGTGEAVDYDALVSAIDDAIEAKDGITVAANGSNVAIDKFWVTSLVMTALEDAIAAAENAYTTATTQTEVNNAVTALNSAISTFIGAKQPGTRSDAGSVTVTGLSSYNSAEVQLGLFQSADGISGQQPDVFGVGTVSSGTVTIELFSMPGGTPWIASGTWYVAFMIGTSQADSELWMSNAMHNFDTNPNPSIALSGFAKITVFEVTLGGLVDMMSNGTMTFDDVFPDGTDMNGFFLMVTGGTIDYATFSATAVQLGYQIGSNSSFTANYSGSDPATANTRIYTDTVFMMMFEEARRGPQVGKIYGTISLTNITAGARISISAEGMKTGGSGDWWSSRSSEITGLGSSGSASNVAWAIIIYQSDLDGDSDGRNKFDTNAEWSLNFRLYVDFSTPMVNKGFEVFVPGSAITINFAELSNNEANVGSLPSTDLGFVTLGGNINVTYNGSTVPYMWMEVRPIEGGRNIGGMSVLPSAASSNWEMLISSSVASGDVYIRVMALADRGDWGNPIFEFKMPIGDITGNIGTPINFNIGDLTNNNLKVLNNPAASYSVYITDNYIDISSYALIEGGDYLNTWTGTGSSVPTSALSDERGYNVLIVSGGERRYINDITFFNGIGVVDWNSMDVLTP